LPPFQRVILADSDKFPDVAETFYRRAITRTQDTLANWLRAQQKRGAIEFDNADAAAGMLLGMLAFQPHRSVCLATDRRRRKRNASFARKPAPDCFCGDAVASAGLCA
jgi:hypothetical protein